ncbi:hypothetical protein [Streptomyces sp. NPDC051776]|uniref:hypothetical protein n=1 Tax=Streptomyces sp. NPDC051776 TaxID=3155414 RepID=UPI00341C3793
MRVRAISATASALLVATLGLTGCEGNKGDNAGGEKPTSSASATSKGSEGKGDSGSGSGNDGKGNGGSGKSNSGNSDNGDISGSGGGDGAGQDEAPPCTNDITDVSFALGEEGSETEYATSHVTIENITDETCLITGGIEFSAEDAVMVDNAELSDKPIEVGPGMSVSAPVAYPDVPQGGEDPDSCLQASEVQVALPDEEYRNVDVTDDSGDVGVFSVCQADEVSLGELTP